MECTICQQYFEPPHWNSRCCSDKCRKRARAITIKKYKQTDKGRASHQRWLKSKAREMCEWRYRQSEKGKRGAVIRTKRYEKKHPDKKKKWDTEYWYRRRGSNAGYMDWQAILDKFEALGNKCQNCGTTERIEIDHIKPLSKGGTNHIDNLQPLCKPCNSAKGNR